MNQTVSDNIFVKSEGRPRVIVVGGGHAGAEAAHAAARLGADTMLITQDIEAICRMSCNPAMGGVAKGQIVREIDAIGGMSGRVTDLSTIQFRMLNRSKGPAMWSPRAQCDKAVFTVEWRRVLENTPNLRLWQDEVTGIEVEEGVVKGVVTRMGLRISADAVVLTNGTFLAGRIFIGEMSMEGGRIGERAAVGLSDCLRNIGFEVERLKTGTPMRIDGRTIDFAQLEVQEGDDDPQGFSFTRDFSYPLAKRCCYMAYTNSRTHEILATGFDRSPMFSGLIHGRGPRYCPSIEDKIVRFAGKERHQLFVEPEGLATNSYYLNGFSSSLPLEVQVEALRSMKGFEHAEIFKPGYAIEYDYFPPTQLRYTLETNRVENLYFAGQINGTTGYEEAACQGLMAGINAVLKLKGEAPFVLSRTQAYIGVLIDDLVTKGVDEPYRMFTSRAEYRILLRQDNADERLTPLSYEKLHLATEGQMKRVEQKRKGMEEIKKCVGEQSVTPTMVNGMLEEKGSSLLQQRVKLENLIARPELTMEDVADMSQELREVIESQPEDMRREIVEGAEIALKYQRYIEKESDVADRLVKFENIELPEGIDYFSIQALSYESREKLSKMKPKTLGQASRISGVSPADVSVLMIVCEKKNG
ncbi:MAG: tRNA uridine-5-carboxymethylaminomethyl(34) synthesis enzyme MnmG [Bacteroidales bacterium]|nr:tRNA uridine-5-carboxymethylaminomethyl(34) synthesis enzyme MnmG [Bacteroidales bacterium]